MMNHPYYPVDSNPPARDSDNNNNTNNSTIITTNKEDASNTGKQTEPSKKTNTRLEKPTNEKNLPRESKKPVKPKQQYQQQQQQPHPPPPKRSNSIYQSLPSKLMPTASSYQQFIHPTHPNHVYNNALLLGMNQFGQIPYSYPNIYPSVTPTATATATTGGPGVVVSSGGGAVTTTTGTPIQTLYNNYPRLNSIFEDPAYQFGGSRRSSILPNSSDIQSSVSIDSTFFTNFGHGLEYNNMNNQNGIMLNNSNNNTNNNNNSNNGNAKIVYNSFSSNNSIPMVYNNSVYSQLPSQYSYFEPSVYDITRDYSFGSNNNSSISGQALSGTGSSGQTQGQGQTPIVQQQQQGPPQPQQNSQSQSQPHIQVPPDQNMNNFGFIQPFNSQNPTDHLISTRRSSEQLDVFLGSKGQPVSKQMSVSSTNRSSINSLAAHTGVQAMSNIGNGATIYSLIPSTNNSRQNSFFVRKFPSSIIHFPDDFSPADIDSFLKRDSTPTTASNVNTNGTANAETLDPLQTNAGQNNNNNNTENSNPTNINSSSSKSIEIQQKSRGSSIFQLPLPSRASSMSLSHIFGPTAVHVLQPDNHQQKPKSPIKSKPSTPQPQMLNQIPQRNTQNSLAEGNSAAAIQPNIFRPPSQFMPQNQMYPYLSAYLQQQQQQQFQQQMLQQQQQQYMYQQHQSQSPQQPPPPQQQFQQYQQSQQGFPQPPTHSVHSHHSHHLQPSPNTPLQHSHPDSIDHSQMVKTEPITVKQEVVPSPRKRRREKEIDSNYELEGNCETNKGSEITVKTEKIHHDLDDYDDKPNVKRRVTVKEATIVVKNSKPKEKPVLDEEEEQELINSNISLTREDGRPLVGATKVDQLMLIIQARQKGVCGNIQQAEDGSILPSSDPNNDNSQILPNPIELIGGVEKNAAKGNKNHQCKYCSKKFTQSTHLDVHLRSHMGVKPYKCEYCDKRFTQGGNLRTHMRLHTGEKPFKCDICMKQFSRKGNLQAHLLTHDSYKPFICKFDGCNKGFTQLGNLKAHQNRFHLDTINELFNKLAQLGDDVGSFEKLPAEERELLNYFSGLYKNLNRGIKGRGRSKKDEADKKE